MYLPVLLVVTLFALGQGAYYSGVGKSCQLEELYKCDEYGFPPCDVVHVNRVLGSLIQLENYYLEILDGLNFEEMDFKYPDKKTSNRMFDYADRGGIQISSRSFSHNQRNNQNPDRQCLSKDWYKRGEYHGQSSCEMKHVKRVLDSLRQLKDYYQEILDNPIFEEEYIYSDEEISTPVEFYDQREEENIGFTNPENISTRSFNPGHIVEEEGMDFFYPEQTSTRSFNPENIVEQEGMDFFYPEQTSTRSFNPTANHGGIKTSSRSFPKSDNQNPHTQCLLQDWRRCGEELGFPPCNYQHVSSVVKNFKKLEERYLKKYDHIMSLGQYYLKDLN